MTLLTVKETAGRLGISRGLVYALVRCGKLRAERFGTKRGTIRISETALDEYRSGCLVEAAPASAPRATSQGGKQFKNLDGERLIQAWSEQGSS